MIIPLQNGLTKTRFFPEYNPLKKFQPKSVGAMSIDELIESGQIKKASEITDDAENLMALIRKQGDYQKKDKRFPKKGTLLDIVSKSVNTNRSIEQVLLDDFHHFSDLSEDVIDIAKKYHIQKEMLSVMDYDDLLVKMVHLLNHHDDLRTKLSQKYHCL